MREDVFRQLLTEHRYTDNQISDCLSGVELLETFLGECAAPKTLATATAEDVPAFAASLIDRDLNERNRFVGIYHYAGMIKNYGLQVGALELFDGFEILGNLHLKIGEELGEETQAAIFEGVDLPVLGTTPIDLSLALAPHTLVVALKGYRQERLELDLSRVDPASLVRRQIQLEALAPEDRDRGRQDAASKRATSKKNKRDRTDRQKVDKPKIDKPKTPTEKPKVKVVEPKNEKPKTDKLEPKPKPERKPKIRILDDSAGKKPPRVKVKILGDEVE